MKVLILASTFAFMQFCVVVCDPVRNSAEAKNIKIPSVGTKEIFCKDEKAKLWSYDFHNCFIDRKINDGGEDLNNIVDRILDHSRDCIKNSTKPCKPDHEGFIFIMTEVINEMKDYCYMYLEAIIRDREKVKDLDCVENVLSIETYKKCFKENVSHKSPEGQVENAISCTNEANKKCSKKAKTDLNRMVRNILHVRQPRSENIEDDPEPEAPMRWYDYIIQPFVSFWKTIKSWFGW